MNAQPQKTWYDHRIRNAIALSGNPDLFEDLDINSSTTRSWLRRGPKNVVSSDILDKSYVELLEIIAEQNASIKYLRGIVCLLSALVRVFGCRLDKHERLPDAKDKKTILRSLEKALKTGIPLHRALRVVGLSRPRYNSWKKVEPACELDDRSSCPKTTPNQLTPKEIATMKELVTDKQYRHMPTGALALFAQRAKLLAASAGTWYRIIKERGWIRPRQRIHPPKPRIGVRAFAPNICWHIDTTVIRLLDGRKLYLHAVIDNFSRKILSWSLCTKISPLTTCEILSQASVYLGFGASPILFADQGNENTAKEVNYFLSIYDNIHRVLAQVEVTFSNSMIEAFWNSLKHNWLFINKLDSYDAVYKLLSFYIPQYNEVIPHSAFQGQTPDEMFYGLGDHIPHELSAYRLEAQHERRRYNRFVSCDECLDVTPPAAARDPTIPSEFPS